MNDYRILFEYKTNQRTKIVKADSATDANTIFLSKIKPAAAAELKILKTTLVEPETKTFNFNSESVADFLQWYLEQIESDEYEFNCVMNGKKIDESAQADLQIFQDFIKDNYLTSVQIVLTGDKK